MITRVILVDDGHEFTYDRLPGPVSLWRQTLPPPTELLEEREPIELQSATHGKDLLWEVARGIGEVAA